MERSEKGMSVDGFIDRSKVRILLCDKDANSSEEVFTLLCRCSYQVTSVRSPRQVIDALNAEGPDIDIILSELDLPMSKGFKMLKYIMRDKDLRRIPVIMMSAQDEVSIVVKCLKFGAADYLVKPLRTNELLNLWTHMWRRRQMLGLAEKSIVNYDFDLVVSDPSDANTNSTTLFSDDTDDKSRKSVNLETCPSSHQEDESSAAPAATPVEAPVVTSSECQPRVPGMTDRRTGQISPFPKKSELKIGKSSAFFTYVKSSMPKSNDPGAATAQETSSQRLTEEKLDQLGRQVDADVLGHFSNDILENHSQRADHPSSKNLLDSTSLEKSRTPPFHPEFSQQRKEDFSQVHAHQRSESHQDVSGFHPHAAYPYYVSGLMNHVVMPSSSMYQRSMPKMQNHGNSAIMSQFNHIQQCPPHMHGMPSFPYYPVGLCLQPGQMPAQHSWPPYGNSSSSEGKLGKVDRREAALMKFRQKRKERCFEKKIRYVNRKKLAERRPRVRGQFVRKVNGVTVDLNGHPASVDDEDDDYEEEEEEEEDDDPTANMDSSPDYDASVCQR